MRDFDLSVEAVTRVQKADQRVIGFLVGKQTRVLFFHRQCLQTQFQPSQLCQLVKAIADPVSGKTPPGTTAFFWPVAPYPLLHK